MLVIDESALDTRNARQPGRDPQVRAVGAFALPDRDELPVGLRGERRVTLEPRGEVVDSKLKAGAPSGRIEVLRVHAHIAPVLSGAMPDDGELAGIGSAETGDDPGPRLMAER